MLRNLFGPRSGSVPSGDFTVTGPYPAAFVPTDLLKTQLHCHTSGSSDGSIPPATMVTNYVNAGYHALALTDHDVVTSQPAGADIAIVGNELSAAAQHIISINSDYVRGGTTDAQTIINGVVADGGQAHIAHPLWSTGMTEAEMAALTGHLGLEIHNGLCIGGTSQNPVTFPGYAVTRWDALLTAGERTGVWGFSVDDLHAVGTYAIYDMGCVKVFVEDATLSDVVQALVDGNFVADVSNFGVTPGYPVRTDDDVTLECTGATRIEAWGRTGLLASANADTLVVDYPFDGSTGYLRFVAIGDYTEPFNSLSDRWAAAEGSWSADGTLHVSSDVNARRLILRRHRQGDFTAKVDVDLSSGGTDRGQLMFNVLNGNYWYVVHMGGSASADHNNKLTIGKSTANSIGSPLASTAFTPSAGTWYTLKMDYRASDGRIRAKVWDRSGAEPDWMVTTTDTSWKHGGFGIRANRTCQFDNFYVDGFQTFYQPLFIDPA